ncbi:NUDIX domain-containing protein [Candidatus Tisiphia endosymbiont of Hybos culiciformis]|uniref:NUDIX domain-containing protein n=1 Tax=Candidatus Tisiphia endosymbiont of Hybos culiciformis TaxID=3139331 RepID=UPI003CCB600C
MTRNELIKLVHLAIISYDNKILLMKRANTSAFAGYFALPGGKIDRNESPKIAAQREAREEIGILPRLDEIDLILSPYYSENLENKEKYLNYFYRINNFIGIISNKEPHLCKKLAFFSFDNIPQPIVPFIKPCLENLMQLIIKKNAKDT